MASLYDLTGDYVRFSELMETEDLTPELEEELREALENMNEDLEEKLENYARIIRNFESDIEGMKAEEERLSRKRKTMENNIKRMKNAMTDAMILTNKTKVKTSLFSFNVQKNPVKVVMDCQELDLVPFAFLIEKDPEVNRKALKEALESDDEQLKESLEGIAHLEQSVSVRIR